MGIGIGVSPIFGGAINAPPVVSVSAPANIDWGATLTATVTATDPEGSAIGTVALLLDGVQVATRSGPGDLTYVVPWGAAVGARSLTATAVDAAGLVGTSPAVAITVVDPSAAVNATDYDHTQNSSITSALANAFGSWTATNLPTKVGGQSDPVGGSGAYLLGTTTDSGPQYHNAIGTVTNGATGPANITIYLKRVNWDWCFVGVNGSDTFVYVNTLTGAKGGVGPGTTATVTAVGNGWWRVDVSTQNTALLAPAFSFGRSDGASSYYQSDGTERMLLYFDPPDFKQKRASQQGYRAGAGLGSLGVLAQSVVANQPFVGTAPTWNQAADGLRFNGNHSMFATFGAALSEYTLFIVVSRKPLGTHDTLIADDDSSTTVLQALADNRIVFSAGSALYTAALSFTEGTHYLIDVTGNGASTIYRDGVLVRASGDSGANSLSGIRVGAWGAASDPLSGRVKHAVVVPSKLSDADRLRIRKALANKYGITLS